MILKTLLVKIVNMEMRNENNMEKRKRKMVSRPVLVVSVKPGTGVASATYSKDNTSSSSIWKS